MSVDAVRLEQNPQPEGLEGARYTAREVARLVRLHRDDARIESYVSHGLMSRCPDLHPRDMDPDAQIARARCILELFRRPYAEGGIGWMPDPTRRESLVAPYLLVDGQKRPVFAAKDCGNLGAAWLAAFLCGCSSVGIPAAVVAHGYRRGLPLVVHILAAVARDWTWKEKYYVDPSQDLPFGACTPFEWEYLVDALTGQVICDAPICLREEGLDPELARRIEGSQPNVEVMNVATGIDDGTTNVAGIAPTVADLEAWRAMMLGDADRLTAAATETKRLAEVLAGFGVGPLEGWSEEQAARLSTLLSAAELLAPWLRDAAHGLRRIIVAPDGSSFGLESLPTDPAVIRGEGRSIWIEARDGTHLTPTVNVAGATPGLPVIAIGVLGGLIPLAIVAVQAFVVYQGLVTIRETVRALAKSVTVREYAKCLEKNDAEACSRWLDEQRKIENAEAETEGQKQKPFLEAISFGKLVLVVGGLVGVGLAAKYVYEEVKTSRGGDYGGRRRNPAPGERRMLEDQLLAAAREYVDALRDDDPDEADLGARLLRPVISDSGVRKYQLEDAKGDGPSAEALYRELRSQIKNAADPQIDEYVAAYDRVVNG